MITYYMAEKGGELCKCEFINVTQALFGYLTLIQSEEFEYRMIEKEEFESNSKTAFRRTLCDTETGKVVGYYTVI